MATEKQAADFAMSYSVECDEVSQWLLNDYNTIYLVQARCSGREQVLHV